MISNNTSFEQDDIGLRRPQLSKELQEVYDTLMNFQKRDSEHDESLVDTRYPRTSIPLNHVNNSNEVDNSDRLSDMLAAYGVNQDSYETPQQPKVKQSEYFIPVDYETYQKWLHEKDKVKANDSKVLRKGKPAKKVAKALHVDEDIDPGDDTSQDAADIISQESKEDKEQFKELQEPQESIRPQHVEASIKIIAHPDHVESPKSKTSLRNPPLLKQESLNDFRKSPPELEESEKEVEQIEDRDENFVIESDLNEKLYSSKSESRPLENAVKMKQTPLKLDLSSSSSLSPVVDLSKKEMPKKLRIHSDSESSAVIKTKQNKADSDVSGPEMENDDDFWN